MSELRLKFRYENGAADTGRLEIYDAAVALRGIARASSIITHAYLNGEIRTHGEAAKGAKIYIDTPRATRQSGAPLNFTLGIGERFGNV